MEIVAKLVKDAQKSLNEAADTVEKINQKLKSGLSDLSSEARTNLASAMTNLESKRGEVDSKIRQLASTSSDATEDLLIGAQIAWSDLKDSIKSASSRF